MTLDETKEFEEFICAVTEGDVQRVAEMLDAGIDVNSANEHGETAFSFACAYDQFEVAKLLHARGAEANSVDVGGGSPLDWAVCHASQQFRDWLITIGAKRHDESYEPWPYPLSGSCNSCHEISGDEQ